MRATETLATALRRTVARARARGVPFMTLVVDLREPRALALWSEFAPTEIVLAESCSRSWHVVALPLGDATRMLGARRGVSGERLVFLLKGKELS